MTDDQFAAIQVGDGYFWILHPNYDNPDDPVFGLTDEDAKLNINTAAFDQLMALPGMTDDIAAAIVDWRDEDNTPSNGGAESDYYLSLPDPYYAKNDNFENVDELLMVRGMTRQYLYGDGTAPPLGTPFGSVVTNSMSTDPQLARGIFDLLTVYSRSPAAPQNGSQINLRRVSSSDRDGLRRLMQRANFSATRISEIMSRLQQRYSDLFDFYLGVKLKQDEYEKIMTGFNVGTPPTSGRININTAPREVLACLGLDSDDIDKLLQQRSSHTSDKSMVWVADVLGSKIVGKGIANQITGQSYQYSADIVAASGNGRSFKRVRVVVDMRSGAPQIVFRRDITNRGWPMDPQVLASLRAGQGPGSSAVGPGGSFSGSMSR
jgi:type II secretory pathway component PulK